MGSPGAHFGSKLRSTKGLRVGAGRKQVYAIFFSIQEILTVHENITNCEN